ncbi:hypothetical protein ES703_110396 [subsurface metagenome]
MMPRDSPSFQWGAGWKSKLGSSPQERTTTLSCSPLPTGTEEWGILGTRSKSSSSCLSRLLTSSANALILARSSRPSAVASLPVFFSRAVSFRACLKPSSSSTFWRRSESSCKISSSGAVSWRLSIAWRTRSIFSRINFMSSINFCLSKFWLSVLFL